MEVFILLVIGVIGIIFGTKMSLALQGGLLILAIMYLNSRAFKRLEIAGFIPLLMIIAFFAGCAIGDISYYIQTNGFNFDFSNPFIVSKK